MDKPTTFNSLFDAIQGASYIDALRHAEFQWIQSRLSWLFISQSFCITGYVVLSIAMAQRELESHPFLILRLGIPFFGAVSCALVGVSVLAASSVARRLTAERRSALKYINENSPLAISDAGPDGDPSVSSWTYWAGELPHRVLPWILAALWLLLLVAQGELNAAATQENSLDCP